LHHYACRYSARPSGRPAIQDDAGDDQELMAGKRMQDLIGKELQGLYRFVFI
jgi:hypothetical protein